MRYLSYILIAFLIGCGGGSGGSSTSSGVEDSKTESQDFPSSIYRDSSFNLKGEDSTGQEVEGVWSVSIGDSYLDDGNTVADLSILYSMEIADTGNVIFSNVFNTIGYVGADGKTVRSINPSIPDYFQDGDFGTRASGENENYISTGTWRVQSNGDNHLDYIMITQSTRKSDGSEITETFTLKINKEGEIVKVKIVYYVGATTVTLESD